MDESEVTVTRDRLVVPGTTYSMGEIRRVGVIRKRRSKIPPILLALVGLAIWITQTQQTIWITWGGLVLVAIAWVWVRRIKTNHRIILDTHQGEKTALETQDDILSEKVVKAIRAALADRKKPRRSSASPMRPDDDKSALPDPKDQ